MPRVEIRGRLNVDQFWPKGSSDADTVVVDVEKVLVDGDESPVFDGAFVLDHGKRQPVLDRGRVRVRLEGIDAPELHYPTTEPGVLIGRNAQYRQPRAQLGCLHLRDKLGPGAALSARVTTDVETPNDVFDVYGRFVGVVVANTAGPGTVVVNEALLEAGLALPSIYTSMDRTAARRYLRLASEARSNQRGVWRWYTTELHFDETMHHEKNADGDDVGPPVLPKLFRRLAVHEVHKGQVRGFKSWLRERRDRVRSMTAWLEQGDAGAEVEDLADYVSDDSPKPRFLAEPAGLVFVEKAGVTYSGEATPLLDWPG